MKNSAIFIVLLLFLAVTLFFWFQVLRIEDLPVAKPLPGGTKKDVEDFIQLLTELSINDPEPVLNLYGRDPFVREEPGQVPVGAQRAVPVSEKFILSSVSYSNLYALAVVNGEILAEGDTISGSEFMIENIEVDKVEISDGKKKYTLEVAPGIGRSR